ncbi:O(6)-methylguanine-induced apoptosis 2 [Malaclemys terrapin pileata]|uniref:O(6)-methylguanine-induced apoptosis 2 n=1 Tax=Malaclemys terrapin pileata TaxID=2991368 RepID=UPI0023A8390A|nr:O(6)-methylguanine-induced apoptosis 2 [Malaclemys terrapin pileata]
MAACFENFSLATSIKGTDAVQIGKASRGYKVSSIPYKYQTRMIPNSEKKGFNSQAKRFQYNQNEIPGPGFYNVVHQSAEINSTSLSKKGTGYFPSMDARLPHNRKPSYPAANAYNLSLAFQSKQDFSTGNSSMFQQPIAKRRAQTSTPAPNQYNACLDFCKQSNNVCARAVFLSKTTRGLSTDKTEKWPSPCHYRINESLVKKSPRILVSCFRSNTHRETKVNTVSPGPAAYQLSKPPKAAKKTPSTRKQNLNFSAPAIPPAKNPPLPGPGQYEIVDYQGPPKHYISSAVFVSNTGRWRGDTSQQGIPGPGTYLPEVPGKQSFIYNIDNKWIPVL